MLDRVGREPKLAMSGGVAFNQGVVRELEHLTGCKLFIPENPQIMGALGAALFAAESTASS
jgi:activator of 2-hydroxyglutaryl-CoA dehydratase